MKRSAMVFTFVGILSTPFKGHLISSTPLMQTPVKGESNADPRALNSSEAIQHVITRPDIDTKPVLRLTEGHIEFANVERQNNIARQSGSKSSLGQVNDQHDLYSLYSSDSGVGATFPYPVTTGASTTPLPSKETLDKNVNGSSTRTADCQILAGNIAKPQPKPSVQFSTAKSKTGITNNRNAGTNAKGKATNKNGAKKSGSVPKMLKPSAELQVSERKTPVCNSAGKSEPVECAVQTENAATDLHSNSARHTPASLRSTPKRELDEARWPTGVKCVAEKDTASEKAFSEDFVKSNGAHTSYPSDHLDNESESELDSEISRRRTVNFVGGGSNDENFEFRTPDGLNVDDFANDLGVEFANTNNNRDDHDLPSTRIPVHMDSLTRLIEMHSSRQELQYLSRRLKEAVARQDWKEMSSITRDLADGIHKLFITSGFVNWQNDLQMALQPVRSENVQLRRFLSLK